MKTNSEGLFEFFLTRNKLAFEKIKEETSATASAGAGNYRPDYLVQIGAMRLIFEVKELTEDEDIKDRTRGYTITTGDHVRSRIEGSRKQIQYGARQGIPSILLIYNNVDPLQLLGTDDRDFIAAMYGEYTILLNSGTREKSDVFNGRNQSLQKCKNTSFSAVGRLSDRVGVGVTLFENVFAKVQAPYEQLPTCFGVRRVEVSTEPLLV